MEPATETPKRSILVNDGSIVRVGRPRKLTPQTAHAIADAVANGSYWEPACTAAGVTYSAVRKWIKQAQEDLSNGIHDSEEVEFLNILSRAEARWETETVRGLSADEDWRARAFLLERRHRDRWGKNDQPQASNVTIVLADSQQSALLELLRLSHAKDVTPTPET